MKDQRKEKKTLECDKIRKYKLRNDYSRETIEVTSIEDIVVENILWWFGHLQRGIESAFIRWFR